MSDNATGGYYECSRCGTLVRRGLDCPCLVPPLDAFSAQARLNDVRSQLRDIRAFSTGATRDADTDKLDYSGFLSPQVLERFAQYMHEKRKMPDGSRRSSRNWKKGIPRTAYLESLLRHVFAIWKAFEEERVPQMKAEIEDDICAALFNIQGLLHEILVGRSVERKEEA